MTHTRTRDTCRRCNVDMRYIGDSAPTHGGHHRAVFECPECGREVQRG